VTAVLDSTAVASTVDPAAVSRPASYAKRMGAFAIDVLLPAGVIATLGIVGWTAPLRGWLWWVFVGAGAIVFVAAAVNRWLLPALKGWTLGRAYFGLAVRTRSYSPAGLLRIVVRDVAHLLDTAALFVGWLWPLWDRRNRTFADLLLRTEVHEVDPPQRDLRRATAGVLIAAALLCAAAVGLSFLVVYKQERAVDATRQQLAEEGPKIVEQMLSYNAESLQQDFSHAQTLTTDQYRPQLISQQQAVTQAGATSNEYWAVSSAVLPMPEPTPTTGSMLLAMQGQRGADAKDLKFITATVRVDFEKSDDGRWRVANLTVLKKPLMNVPGQ
jgi:Mce-associated membrane protein